MYVKKIVKLMKKDEGSGLILALMTLMVLSILGASLGAITIGSYKLGDVNRDDNSAYYISEAGTNMAYDELQTMVNATYNDSLTETSFFESIEFKIENDVEPAIYRRYYFEKQFGELPEATVTIEKSGLGTTREYLIKSIGTIGQRTRTLEKNVTVTWIPKSNSGPGYGDMPTTTTIAKDKLLINGGVQVTGTVYLDSPEGILDIKDQFDNEGLDNLTVYVNPGNSEVINNNNSKVTIKERDQSFNWDVYTELVNKFPLFPKDPDFTELPSTLNTNDNNISIVLDSLTITEDITIIGDGRVDIYVKNHLNIEQNVKINVGGRTDQLQIFYGNPETETVSETFETKNNMQFKGILFAKNAKIDLGNNAIIDGVIISGGDTVTLAKGTFNTLIIAPNATVSLNTGDTKNAITGITVGKIVELAQNMSLEFSDNYLEDFPLRLPDPEGAGGSGDGTVGSSDGDINSGGGELIITEPGVEN